MTTSDNGLDVDPVVDHLDATVRSLLKQDNADLSQLPEVWRPSSTPTWTGSVGRATGFADSRTY